MACDVADPLGVAEPVVTAEELVLVGGEELTAGVGPLPLLDELHAAVSSKQALSKMMVAITDLHR